MRRFVSSSAADGTPIFDCDGSCGCGGCYTGDITYTYSGYSLTFGGWSCGCVPRDDPRDPHPEEQGGASGPSVSAHFSKSAIIFEDAYENEPGVTVPRRSTDTEVEFYVYGGTNGGTYAFSIVNAVSFPPLEVPKCETNKVPDEIGVEITERGSIPSRSSLLGPAANRLRTGFAAMCPPRGEDASDMVSKKFTYVVGRSMPRSGVE